MTKTSSHSRLVAWLSDTSVPRWQIALGFILATLATVYTTIHTETASIHKQDAIAKVTAFRDSAAEIDTAARDLTYAVFDHKGAAAEEQAFDHAVIKHLKDVDAVSELTEDDSDLKRHRSAVVYASTTAHKFHDANSGQEFFAAMAVVRDSQDKVMAKVKA